MEMSLNVSIAGQFKTSEIAAGASITNIGWPPLGARTGGFESVQDAERRFGDIGLQSLCRKEAQ
jgi:hypothetical protein